MESVCTAKTLMTRNTRTLSPESHALQGFDFLLAHTVSGVPVIDSRNRYLGLFSERCCLNLLNLAALSFEDVLPVAYCPIVRSFMVSRMHLLEASCDVLDGINLLLKHQISGAPVLDNERNYLGVFSEKTSIDVLLGALYDQLPTTSILGFLNRDLDRLISSSMSLWGAAGLFVSAKFRRLIVFEGRDMVGLVARRDLLKAGRLILKELWPAIQRESIQLPVSAAGDSQFPPRCERESVCTFMDVNVQVISPDTDIFTIAQIFRTTNYRRLPVIEHDKFIGLVSRKSLLQVAWKILCKSHPPPPRMSAVD